MSMLGEIWRHILAARRERKTGVPETRPLFDRPVRPRPKWLADETALDALIEVSGFANAAADIHRRAEPCLYIFEAGRAPDAALGATRFGGLPDLPADMAWPGDGAENPLRFYAQIDLRDLPGVPGSYGLPQSGLLLFFTSALDLDPDPILVAAPLISEGVPLVRRSPPVDRQQFDFPRSRVTLNPVSVVFERGLSFPLFDMRWVQQLENADPDGNIDALLDGLRSPSGGDLLGQMLGYASWEQDDLREELYFAEAGRPGKQRLRLWTSWEDWERAKEISSTLRNGTVYRPWRANDDEDMRWILDNAAAVTDGVERWRFLLSIESSTTMDLWINDANAIYFLTHAERLRLGDFSGVQATTTQS